MNDALRRVRTSARLATLKELFREQALAAAVTGATDLPIADRATEWDGPAAMRRVFDFYTDDESGSVDTDGIARAFLYRDDDADPTTQAAYKLGYADIIDGTLTMVPRGVSASAGGHGVNAANIPEEDKARIRSRICGLYDRIREDVEDWPLCPFDDDAETADTGDEDGEGGE